MLVKDLMTSAEKVISVTPDTPVTKVAELLHTHSYSGMPVVNGEGVVQGMINERDFLASNSQVYLPTYIKLLSETDYIQGGNKTLPYVTDQIVRTKASDIMNRHVWFAHPEMTLEEVVEIFASKGNNPIAVTDEQNRLQGILSRSDLLKPLLRHPVATMELAAKSIRPIDQEVEYVTGDFRSRFAYVAKARANVWLTTATVLFIVGFVAGIIYVADPRIFS